jgi:PAS domain-containing protein
VALSGEPAQFEQQAAALRRCYDVYAFRIGEPEHRRVAIRFSDITTRKETLRALHVSEQRYRALAHATANVLYRMNADGTQMLELSGGPMVAHRGALSLAAALDAYVHPDDRALVTHRWTSAVAAGTVFELEHRAQCAEGSSGWVLSRAVPVRNQDGQVMEWVGTATDITARKEGEEPLRRSEAANEAGGLGLGLAIVRSLVAAHGGTVLARSEGVNRGSEFVVRLPALASPPPARKRRRRRRSSCAHRSDAFSS